MGAVVCTRLGESEDQEGGHTQEPIHPQASIPCPWGATSLQGAVFRGSQGSGITQIWSGWWGEHQSWSLSPDTASLQQEFSGSSPKRRRAEDKDEGIGSPDIWEDEKAEDLRREMIELRQQLDKERSVRMMLEEQVRPHGAGFGCGAAVCGTAVAGHGVVAL